MIYVYCNILRSQLNSVKICNMRVFSQCHELMTLTLQFEILYFACHPLTLISHSLAAKPRPQFFGSLLGIRSHLLLASTSQ